MTRRGLATTVHSAMYDLLSHLRRKGAVALLGLALSVLSLHAIIPAGYMIVPSSAQLFAVVPCPSSNALAWNLPLPPAGHKGIDHAAMGHHGPVQQEGQGPPEEPSQPKADCAFSVLSMSAMLPGSDLQDMPGVAAETREAVTLPALDLALPRRLRPPLRGPPL